MRKKLMALTFALVVAAAALGLFSPRPAQADICEEWSPFCGATLQCWDFCNSLGRGEPSRFVCDFSQHCCACYFP